jgi:hypothetical protein
MADNRWDTDDIIEADRRAAAYPELPVTVGLELTYGPTHTQGVVTAFTVGQRVVLEDRWGQLHEYKPFDGAFLREGKRVALVAGVAPIPEMRQTASGSVDPGSLRARRAEASRIWVEGIHDAELVEKIWGDDLRVESIVVEPLHGADELQSRVAEFRPAPQRRLGVLLDHLVSGSKESRIAAVAADPNVLIAGHPYVDIWEAIRPAVAGITAWPRVPRGVPWKDGVLAALGRDEDPATFWQSLLGRVTSYRDIETPLVNAVERLIDFVTAVG